MDNSKINKNWWGNKRNKIHPVDFNDETNKEWSKEIQKVVDDCKTQHFKELSEQQDEITNLTNACKNYNKFIAEKDAEISRLKSCQSVCVTYKSENGSIVKSECPLLDQIEELKIENTQLQASASFKQLKEMKEQHKGELLKSNNELYIKLVKDYEEKGKKLKEQHEKEIKQLKELIEYHKRMESALAEAADKKEEDMTELKQQHEIKLKQMRNLAGIQMLDKDFIFKQDHEKTLIELNKTRATFETKVKKLKSKLQEYDKRLKLRLEDKHQSEAFIEMLKKENRTTDEELRKYFKREK